MDRDIGYFAAAPAPNLVAFAASLSSAPRPPGPPARLCRRALCAR